MDIFPSSTDINYELKNSDNPLKSFNENDLKISGTSEKYFRRRHMYFSAVSCLFLSLTVGLSSGYSATATYDMQYRSSSRVKPTDSEVSWISSILGLGIMLGGCIAGPLVDKIGRKDALVFNVIPAGLGWIMICYARTPLVIIIGRFICGLACAVICVAAPTYCVEIATAEVRGFLGSGFQGFLVIGHLISVSIGAYINWDHLALNGAIFSIVGVICFSFMPESPRWLLSKGRLNEAILIMNKLQGGTIDAEKECKAIFQDLQNKPKLSLKEIKNPTIYKPTIIAIIIFFFLQFSGANVIFFYSSEIFKVAKNFMNPKEATIVLAVFQVIGTVVSNLIVDKVGRKILLALSGIFMALTLTVLGIYYYMSSNNDNFTNKYNWVPLTSLVLFVIAYAIGYGPVSILMNSEMLPTKARSTMTGLIGFFNGGFSFIVLQTFDNLRKLLNDYGAFWFYSAFSILGVIFVVFVVPETKGKKLEDIENNFRSRKQKEQNISIGVIS